MTDDRQFFLSTSPAGRRERQLALAFVLVSVGIFLAAVPFVTIQLAQVSAFIPIYESMLVIIDLITAILLLGQFNVLRSRALLVLASGYLFTAFITVAHALTFPGLFAPTGLLGAGPHSTAWLYILWHGGFPLFVIAYALLKDERREPIGSEGFARSRAGVAIFSSVAAVLVVVCGLTLLATAGYDFFPAGIQEMALAIQGNRATQTFTWFVSADWIISFLALIVLWRRRPHTVLDLWLMAVMGVWLFDIALSAVLNAGRFDLGWYAGRIYGLVAASLVLIVLLIEKSRLYTQLVAAHASERQERQLVQEKTAELTAVNKELDASIAALRESEARLRSLIQFSSDFYWETDAQHRFTVLEVGGDSKSEFFSASHLGRTRWEVPCVSPDADGWQAHRAVLEARLPFRDFETARPGGDGDVRYYTVSGEPAFDAEGCFQGYRGVGKEITERKQAEEALFREGALQRAIFNSANFSIIATDAKGVIQIFNIGAERMLGYTAAEMMNKITPADISDPQEVIARAGDLSVELGTPITPGFEALVFKASRGIEDIYELTYIRKDGSRFSAVVSVTALRDAQENIIGYLLIGTDNTARKQVETARALAEKAMVDAKIEAERANAAKDTFLATMSHEIRTPLNGLLGMLELLGLSRLDGEQRGTLEIARDSGRGLVRIIDDVLDHAKIEAGKLEIRPEPASIGHLLRRVLNTYSAVASAHGLELTQFLDPRISPSLLADSLRLSQILNNFVSNALKFTTEGYVEIRAELLGRADGTDTVRLSVKDTGIGIAPEAQQRLFRPFEQADAATARLHGGTGLGLSISHRLADMMSGTIEVKSAPGEGTTMSVTLTLPITNAAPAELGSGATLAVAPIFAAAAAGVGPQVLVVDDHPTNRELLARQIAVLGLRVRTAAEGREGFALWQAGGIALVITDCNMPQMDGYAFARAIREIEAKEGRPRTPIIAWTANVLPGAAARCHASGMDYILTKPTELAALRETLLKWLPSVAMATDGPDEVADTGPGPTQTACIGLVDLTKIAATAAERAEILLDFIIQTRSDLVGLHAALTKQDFPACACIAHRMKGSSRMVGAKDLAAACETMERAARQGNAEDAGATKVAMDRTLEQLEAHLAETTRENLEQV